MSSDLDHSSPAELRRLFCPKCQQTSMRRIQRQGFLQTKVLPVFGYYPWECILCRMVKFMKNRGPNRSGHSRRSHGKHDPS